MSLFSSQAEYLRINRINTTNKNISSSLEKCFPFISITGSRERNPCVYGGVVMYSSWCVCVWWWWWWWWCSDACFSFITLCLLT